MDGLSGLRLWLRNGRSLDRIKMETPQRVPKGSREVCRDGLLGFPFGCDHRSVAMARAVVDLGRFEPPFMKALE